MHFVHSLWSKPLIVNRRNVEFKTSLLTTILCNATSVAWVNHLGAKINLYGVKLKWKQNSLKQNPKSFLK